MDNSVGIGMFFLVFVMYWWLLARLVDAVLESKKLRGSHWILVGAVNAFLLFSAFRVFSNVQLGYCVILGLMLFELVVFYRDSFLGALLCVLACAIHIDAAFMVILGGFCSVTGYAPWDVLINDNLLLWCCVGTFFLLDFCILGAIKLVPLGKVRLINQHKEQQWFIIAWMAVSGVFLFYMESLFHSPSYPADLAISQVVASLVLLSELYIVLFFSIKTSTLLGYKEKNAELEQVIQQEQQYRNSMLRDALASYEVNVTQDLFLHGLEQSRDDMDEVGECYTDMMILMSQKMIYSEDIPEFIRNCGRSNILRLYEKGQQELITEYRRIIENGEYVWVRSITNLVKDKETGDVKAFICVKNIDDEKKNQLELQYRAERDPLTGLYNRSAAHKLVDEHLAFGKNLAGSALFMIDVDSFKEINDHLGHIYGDAVLCELAEKLTRIFRSNDIVGRIGGDEYIVFLKDSATPQMIETKAAEICKAFYVTYQGTDKNKHTISSSIGIAFFPRDGSGFEELYAHADVALYAAKSDGKNNYKIYDGSNFSAYTSSRTEFKSAGNILQKGFRENRIEYVFKILYQSENPVEAIHAVLELVARHFSFERGYIFETSKDGKFSSNTFEWCAEGVTPEIDNLQKLSIDVVATAHSHFQQCGTFILKSLYDLPEAERAVLEPQGIKSMFQFGIFDKTRLLGFIGFDNCRSEAIPDDIEIDEMKTICNILATFFVKQYIDEASTRDLLARQEVMNHLENYIYVIQTDTFEILFMNEKIQALLNKSEYNTACYSFFRGKSRQCEDCPMHTLINTDTDRVVEEIYNDALEIWMEASASLVRWTDGSLACLISCSDITKQKEEHLNHIRELEQLIYVDGLAGCKTYHKFKIEARNILEEQQDVSHLLVKLDIDNFKLVNQIYGYEKGNEILCRVAEALEKTMRNENEIFARMGNDEFIALLTINGEDEINQLNKNFIKNFNQLVQNDFSFRFRFPHGRYIIKPYEAKDVDIKDMFERANIAHKAAKMSKNIDFAYYNESMTKEALRVKAIENKMIESLKNEEFHVHLQPKYYLKDETIGGAEALVRWRNEDGDLFYPNTFIPVFEKNGFITKLDFYVFEKVCHVIKSWEMAGIEPVTVSVNFSRLHLDNVNFVKRLCEIADHVGVEKEYLEIEITETVIFDHIDTLEVLLNEIHKNGFRMSMDDFGSGYSSLGMLKDIPVDVIKMDRSFFADQRDQERSKIVVGSIIKMASDLGIRIVAEGVEERVHIDFLRELNCDMVQGYYYAKPMPVEDFTSLLCREREIRQ